MNKLPEIKDNTILYAYKERWFTGFAPCFDDGLYSLACCKGRMRRNSIRRTFCDEGKDVWILSIAAQDISDKDHCFKDLDYTGGDMLYLAHVEKLLSWKEYSDEFFKKRRDAIYEYKPNKNEMKWDESWKKKADHGPDDIGSDCKGEFDDYPNIKQIVLADEYYVFKPGSGEIIRREDSQYSELHLLQNMGRSYRCKDLHLNEVVQFMKDNPDSYEYKRKFDDTKNSKQPGGCGEIG